MTAIIGFTKNNKVYMAGDRAASSQEFSQEITHPKIFIKGKVLIGYTTSFRFGDILEYHLKIPKSNKKLLPRAYVVKKLVPAIRAALVANNYIADSANEDSGTALIGYKGSLFILQSDWSIVEHSNNIQAVGSGWSVALGATTALLNTGMKPKAVLKEAMRITAFYDNTVSAKCDVLHV